MKRGLAFLILFILGFVSQVQAGEPPPPQAAGGLACQLIVHPPLHGAPANELPVELTLKNTSSQPLRVTTFCMAWRGSGSDMAYVWFDDQFKSDSPPYEEKYRKVVTLAPGQTTTLTDRTAVPEKSPFRLNVTYGISAECGQKLNVWHGDIAAPPVMVQIEPFKVWPAGK
jgi:hypothetical protein